MKKRYLFAGLALLAAGVLYSGHSRYNYYLKSKLREELRPEIEREYAARIKAEIEDDECAVQLAMSIAANQDENPLQISINEWQAFFHELGMPTSNHSFRDGQMEYHIDRTEQANKPISFYHNKIFIGDATRENLLDYIGNHIAHK